MAKISTGRDGVQLGGQSEGVAASDIPRHQLLHQRRGDVVGGSCALSRLRSALIPLFFGYMYYV